MTGDGFTWEAMYADIRAAERGSDLQRDLIQAAHSLARGDDMGGVVVTGTVRCMCGWMSAALTHEGTHSLVDQAQEHARVRGDGHMVQVSALWAGSGKPVEREDAK